MRLARSEVEEIAMAAAKYAEAEVLKNPESLCESYVDYFEHRLWQLLNRAEIVHGLERTE